MSGPTVYSQLMDAATKQADNAVVEILATRFSEAAHDIGHLFLPMLRDAYLAGVRDGFHEGLTAARSQETEESGA